MEILADILSPEQGAINTKTSRPSRYDENPEENITQMMAQGSKADFNQPVATCEKCGDPVQKDCIMFGAMRRMPVMCRCRVEECRRDDERFEAQALQRRLDKFRTYSLMDEGYLESTFENWIFRGNNRKLYELGRAYCDEWDTVYANNRGILFHGVAGNGKTFLAFAIANELDRRGKAVLAISVSRILNILKDSYSQHGEIGEVDILSTLNNASLLILDDIGVENKTAWAYEKLYNIIDARYRAKKPTIITTNFTIDGLRENLSIVDARYGRYDQSNRIYDRIIQMCSLVEVRGDSWRIHKAEENSAALFRELGLTKTQNGGKARQS